MIHSPKYKFGQSGYQAYLVIETWPFAVKREIGVQDLVRHDDELRKPGEIEQDESVAIEFGRFWCRARSSRYSRRLISPRRARVPRREIFRRGIVTGEITRLDEQMSDAILMFQTGDWRRINTQIRVKHCVHAHTHCFEDVYKYSTWCTSPQRNTLRRLVYSNLLNSPRGQPATMTSVGIAATASNNGCADFSVTIYMILIQIETKKMTAKRIQSGSRVFLFQPFASRCSDVRGGLMILAMLFAVLMVYISPPRLDTVLIGADYLQMHSRRMQFARDALFATEFSLPAWYPRELLGAPFWSNLQSFPFIPTRLLIVLSMDPMGPYAYGVAVTLSAMLAALFTYLYMRKIGLGLTASAAAGWTFACSGFYVARVATGHLPLLEAYPALPLLLWVIESQQQAQMRGESSRKWIVAIAVSSACVMLAGHPQLPVYAMTATGIYALWKSESSSVFRIWGAMIVGVGCAAFALVPMALLIGRSTRVLALDPAANDIAMPYGRLAAFFLPWRDGFPFLNNNPDLAFRGYPTVAYFWDTVCYIGILPWLSLPFLLAVLVRLNIGAYQRKTAIFIGMIGATGIVLSLPFMQRTVGFIPATIFRSPARLIYLSEFALAIGLGVGIHLATASQTRIARILVPLLLTLHVADLGRHNRWFIARMSLLLPASESESLADILKNVGDGRSAIDYELMFPMNRTQDDIGFFDSIMLARSYRMLMSLAEARPDVNIQNFNGSELSVRALAAMGVKVMLTPVNRKDMSSDQEVLGVKVYNIPAPSRRAEFFAGDRVHYLTTNEIHAALRDPKFALTFNLLLPREAKPPISQEPVAGIDQSLQVSYRRPDSDQIECTVTTGQHGYLRVIESWDPGWSATVDGSPVEIVPALDALLAVPIGPGRHEVRFVYRTPGASVGQTISLVSLLGLSWLVWISGAKRRG